MPSLARKLRTLDYFTLAFGTMVGVGWLVVMDDWLRRGGPLGAMLGFALGGAAVIPIAYVYGRLVIAIPDAGSEIAYTARVFPRSLSFATGWMMTLAYLIVCPWEAVAIGKIAAYLLPSLSSAELYRVGGKPVYLPHLVMGLALVSLVTLLNYRGIRLSATFQNWTTFGVLALFGLFVSLGLTRGEGRNLLPLFSQGGALSVLLVVQIVPYFLTGFESVPKCAEEASPEFRARGFSLAIIFALVVGVLFYITIIAVVAYVHSWPSLTTESFATAVAFRSAFRTPAVVDIILAAAILSLLKIFNGNFIAASRLLFALGRRGLVDNRLGRIHPANLTPANAVLAIGALSALATFLGESILIPITEVGSLASAVGWLATCLAYYRLETRRRERALAALGALVASLLLLMKLLPFVPGHFSRYEFSALGLWCLLGALLARRKTTAPPLPASIP